MEGWKRGIIRVSGELWCNAKDKIISSLKEFGVIVVRDRCDWQMDEQELMCESERFEPVPFGNVVPMYKPLYKLDTVSGKVDLVSVDKVG